MLECSDTHTMGMLESKAKDMGMLESKTKEGSDTHTGRPLEEA